MRNSKRWEPDEKVLHIAIRPRMRSWTESNANKRNRSELGIVEDLETCQKGSRAKKDGHNHLAFVII